MIIITKLKTSTSMMIESLKLKCCKHNSSVNVFLRFERSFMSQKFIEITDCLWYEVAELEIEWCESICEWIINKVAEI
jgi:hypothetical protein